jgi:hypothetical protein
MSGKPSLIPEAIRFLNRAREVTEFYSSENNVVEFMKYKPNVNYRYFIEPEVDLEPLYMLLEFGID